MFVCSEQEVVLLEVRTEFLVHSSDNIDANFVCRSLTLDLLCQWSSWDRFHNIQTSPDSSLKVLFSSSLVFCLHTDNLKMEENRQNHMRDADMPKLHWAVRIGVADQIGDSFVFQQCTRTCLWPQEPEGSKEKGSVVCLQVFSFSISCSLGQPILFDKIETFKENIDWLPTYHQDCTAWSWRKWRSRRSCFCSTHVSSVLGFDLFACKTACGPHIHILSRSNEGQCE